MKFKGGILTNAFHRENHNLTLKVWWVLLHTLTCFCQTVMVPGSQHQDYCLYLRTGRIFSYSELLCQERILLTS